MKEALKLALEALERYQIKRQDFDTFVDVITAIKEALALTSTQCEVQDELCSSQEPVAFGMLRADGLILDVICPDEHESFAGEYTIPLYTTPPKRPWVGLTDEFYITNMFDMGHYSLQIVFKSRKNADEFKAALQEKNT